MKNGKRERGGEQAKPMGEERQRSLARKRPPERKENPNEERREAVMRRNRKDRGNAGKGERCRD